MKLLYTIILISCCTLTLLAQEKKQQIVSPTLKKGRFYAYWGWNRGHYTNSDITMKGENFDFVLKNVVAKDRQSNVELDVYLNPISITVPQTNFRIGYFFKDGWDVSLGFDHMKYVMQQGQTVKISGIIKNTNTQYNGVYDNEDIVLAANFLEYEHTDGLNYINLEMRRHVDVMRIWKQHPNWLGASAFGGLGAGVLVPRTDARLLGQAEWDQYHLAGYGIAPIFGANIVFFQHFFLQTEIKGGFIDLPSVRLTSNPNDKGKQSFLFSQQNILLGWSFNL